LSHGTIIRTYRPAGAVATAHTAAVRNATSTTTDKIGVPAMVDSIILSLSILLLHQRGVKWLAASARPCWSLTMLRAGRETSLLKKNYLNCISQHSFKCSFSFFVYLQKGCVLYSLGNEYEWFLSFKLVLKCTAFHSTEGYW